MLNKPALLKWANRQGLAGIDIDKARDESKADGLSMHEQIETGEFSDHDLAQAHMRFMSGKEVIARERKIETEWFVGRYDVLLRDGKGQTILADYKRNRSRRIYFENKLQLVAYSMAEPADRLAIVCLPDFAIVECFADREKCAQILIALSTICRLRSEMGES